MAKKVTTLFIRDDSINLLVVKGRRVEKWASLLLEPGLVSQGLILDEDQVAAKVKELFQLEGIRTRTVIAGLSGFDSLYRIVTLPELPDAILPEAVRHEASRAMPVSLDEVYLSFQRIPAPSGETRVFLTVFPRNTADALIRTLQRAGLDMYLMDLAPLALCRIPDEPRSIIVNSRLEHLDVIVIADRLPQLIRRLSLPGEIESLSDKQQAVADEFNRTVAFYNSGHIENPLDSTVPVFICGEFAEEPETWQSLVGDLGSSVSLLPSPLESPEGFNPNAYLTNIGLALKELLPENEEAHFSIVNFNAIPKVELPRALPVTKILIPIGIVVCIAALVYMGLRVRDSNADISVLRSQLEATQRNISQQNRQISTLKQQIEAVEAQIEGTGVQIEPVKATAAVFNTTYASLGEEREDVDRDLGEIVTLLPTDVNLTEVNHEAGSAVVKGVAPYEQDIFQYARALRASTRFSVVIISSINEDIKEVGEEEIKQYQFTFTIK